MRYTQFEQQLKPFPVISLGEIYKLWPAFDNKRFSEWQRKGYIQKLIKGYYRFAESDLDEQTLFAVANEIYFPSYVSLESALSHYGLVPEIVRQVTSISTRRTTTYHTPVATFSYRTVKHELFFGYDLLQHHQRGHLKIATPEKAVLDFLYLNPHIATADHFNELRWPGAIFKERVREPKFWAMLARYSSPALEKRARNLWDFYHA